MGNAVLDSTVVFALLMESDRLPSQARDKRIFTKTGSGQTYGISKRGDAFCLRSAFKEGLVSSVTNGAVMELDYILVRNTHVFCAVLD